MKKRKKFRKYFIILEILILILIILTLINIKFWNYLEKKEIKIISIPDRCSILFGNILHNIKDEAGCENFCRSECLAIKKDFYKSDFYFKEQACHECTCYCK